MIMLLLALAVAAANPPAEKVFDDWAVACDNVKRCEATALQGPEQFGDTPSQLLLTREAGPTGGLDIAIDPAELVKGPATLFIDGRHVATGIIGDNFRIGGAPAEALAKAMVAGNALELRRGAKVLAHISLAGVSAALRFIDAEQGRVGTVTALVATGNAPAASVPAARALPGVPAIRAASGAPGTPSRAVLGELATLGDCDSSIVTSDLPVERYKLDATTTLVLIPCGSGAYNVSTAAFVLRGGKGEPAEFDVRPDWAEGEAPGMLTNSSFSTSGGAVLTSSAKGRGLGDCGGSQRWVWDGSRFRMIEARALGECRGSINWLTLFRAKPLWR